ncbi:rab family GTPase [Anopheles sinensis]|uniref:Rab family GTPase n=1 Tax=Anopheles sinensis TaxID=74873 RepID=A0A084W951_ANOSI|nr:rab family GTPase [Anopheles sinensis]
MLWRNGGKEKLDTMTGESVSYERFANVGVCCWQDAQQFTTPPTMAGWKQECGLWSGGVLRAKYDTQSPSVVDAFE